MHLHHVIFRTQLFLPYYSLVIMPSSRNGVCNHVSGQLEYIKCRLIIIIGISTPTLSLEFASFRVILEFLKTPVHIPSKPTAEISGTTSTPVICSGVDVVYYQVHWSLSLTAASWKGIFCPSAMLLLFSLSSLLQLPPVSAPRFVIPLYPERTRFSSY